MDRDRRHARVVAKGRPHTVAVMGVQIDMGDAGTAKVDQAQDGQDRGVEMAKAMGAVGHAVVGAARGVIGHPLCMGNLRRVDRAADRCGSARP